MSIWAHAVGGGLRGLGASITLAENEKREARGIALREAYLEKRQGRDQAFRASESALQRTHSAATTERVIGARADEGVLNREHSAGIAGDRMEHSADQTAAIIEAREEEGAANRTLRRDEGAANRALRRDEGAARRGAGMVAAARRISELEGDLDSPKLLGEVANLYSEPGVDDQGHPTGETVPNFELAGQAIRFMKRTDEWPWDKTITVDDLYTTMRSSGKGFDETVTDLTALRFHIPPRVARTAKKRLAIER